MRRIIIMIGLLWGLSVFSVARGDTSDVIAVSASEVIFQQDIKQAATENVSEAEVAVSPERESGRSYAIVSALIALVGLASIARRNPGRFRE